MRTSFPLSLLMSLSLVSAQDAFDNLDEEVILEPTPSEKKLEPVEPIELIDISNDEPEEFVENIESPQPATVKKKKKSRPAKKPASVEPVDVSEKFVHDFSDDGIGETRGKSIPLGIEAVTGLRSQYFYRGFDIGDSVLDFQMEAEIALGGEGKWFMNVGGWYAVQGDESFYHAGGLLELRREWESFSIGLRGSYHEFDHEVFESGVDVGVITRFFLSEGFDVSLALHRDFEAEAWYGEASAAYSMKVNDRSFFVLRAGTSWVEDYYGRNGLNHYFARLSYTYNVNEMVSITPFVGYVQEADSDDPLSDDSFEVGIWFEVSF